MATDCIEPTFGPKGCIPAASPAWWACRANENSNGTVVILHDRQDAGGPAKDVLLRYLNGGVLQAIKDRISGRHVEGAVLRFKLPASFTEDTVFTSKGTPWDRAEKDNVTGLWCHVRAAGGYFYVAVWADPSAVVLDLLDTPKPGMRPWSGHTKGWATPPQSGETVTVAMNRIGPSLVLRHFVEEGFLGLVVLPLNPPNWYIRQNGSNALAHVFGLELAPPTEPAGPNPLDGSELSEASQSMIRALFRTQHGAIPAIRKYREITGASLVQAREAIEELCAGLTQNEYSVWGTAEVDLAGVDRRLGSRFGDAKTREGVLARKRTEVYAVGFLGDGRCLLLNRNYGGIGIVDVMVGKMLVDPNPTKINAPPTVVTTNRWSEYSLSHDACDLPAGTAFDAVWIAHPESTDGKAAVKRTALDTEDVSAEGV
jgi:hypothetical protein